MNRTPRVGAIVAVAVVGLVALVSAVGALALLIGLLVLELRREDLAGPSRWVASGAGLVVLLGLGSYWVFGSRLDVMLDERFDPASSVIIDAVLALPLAVATAILVARASTALRGRDASERLVATATAGLPRQHEEWVRAMHAELASIDDRRERRRFAVGCAVVALRLGWDTRHAALAAALGVTTLAVTATGTRLAVTTGRREWTTLPVAVGLVLAASALVIALVVAWRSGSFRVGLTAGAAVAVVTAAAYFAVAIPGMRAWYEASGLSVSGNPLPPSVGLAFPVSWVLLGLSAWAACPVLGAALGARLPTIVASPVPPA